ncbi:SDR family oxidoreductase [Paenibacillus sp. 19GGS1-52]|uniref:SDR family NAD(P)-dependent oxidoreductase n=1 Tax=Paenibacillus sp. 19GGS1-52 TaxID=2758563 RepID=UPI001EFABB46|nr:SDR family NAD(P)-dependent oxidoreductase [Paenibacillus sp. 19GGS1-52]ULO09217.1 SDR family oxidoreductase [Paenibacillus sp. 19GGS1-52]
MKGLSGQTAVVTGAGSGIGRSIALRLAIEGAIVVVTDMNVESAKETLSLLNVDEGQKHSVCSLDVTKKEGVLSSFADIHEEYGAIDILINNAGVSTMNRIEDLTEQEWDFNFDVNIKGIFLCTQAVYPYMKEQKKGRIINTASMAGKRGVPLLAHYAASKWAVIGFTKSAAIEMAPYNITVNCVCPGFVNTGMQSRELKWEAELRGMTPDEVREEYIRMTPLGRLEEAEDVARVVWFLASKDADFITGEALNITGGADLL